MQLNQYLDVSFDNSLLCFLWNKAVSKIPLKYLMKSSFHIEAYQTSWPYLTGSTGPVWEKWFENRNIYSIIDSIYLVI